MSTQITTAFVQQYKSNVLILAQQKPSKFRGTVRVESVNAKNHYFERLGSTSPQKRTSRHADTPLVESPHTRRMVTLYDYEWADLVDQQDKIRLLISPQSEYAVNAAYAMNRGMDDEIIAAFSGSAWGGETGSSEVTFPAGQNVAQDGTPSSLTLNKVLAAKKILDVNEIEPDGRFITCSPAALSAMLGVTQVTSADYNSVKALVRGEIDTFLGFKWIISNRLPIASTGTYRAAYAWHRDCMAMALGQDVVTRITERADKSYSVQVYLAMTIGATRVQDEGVVQIPCLSTD